jgi:hypothetical protein
MSPEAQYLRRDGTVVVGHAAIRALLQSLMTVATEIELNVVRVIALNGIALVYNDWKLRTASEDGRVRESAGKAVEVVRRQSEPRVPFTPIPRVVVSFEGMVVFAAVFRFPLQEATYGTQIDPCPGSGHSADRSYRLRPASERFEHIV